MDYQNLKTKVVPSLEELWSSYYKVKELEKRLGRMDSKSPSPVSSQSSPQNTPKQGTEAQILKPTIRSPPPMSPVRSTPNVITHSLSSPSKTFDASSPTRKSTKLMSPKNDFMV